MFTLPSTNKLLFRNCLPYATSEKLHSMGTLPEMAHDDDNPLITSSTADLALTIDGPRELRYYRILCVACVHAVIESL